MTAPHASILIPNFNNGRASSRAFRIDFIEELFQSLLATLHDDPTPLEIIVADDGSTDDSLPTCRRWAGRPWGGWRGGQPFLRLIELEHSGVVASVMNRLLREARGDVFCRLDGDVVIHTRHWVCAIAELFRRDSDRLGVVGAKQLTPNLRIHSMGDWILHPRGYHHIGQGSPRESFTAPLEVDHVMGCFYCHPRAVWQSVGDYDESILRGQTIDFGLRVRLQGWRTVCVPSIEFTHRHSERGWRGNFADTPEGLNLSLDRFAAKWGFDRLTPDLDEVERRYVGTPLLWNPAVFGARHDGPQAGLDLQPSAGEWEAVRGALTDCDNSMRLLIDSPWPSQSRRELGDLIHDLRHAPIALPWPVERESLDRVILMSAIERHANPTALLREAHRVLAPAGRLIVVAQQRSPDVHESARAWHPYRAHELNAQIANSRLFEIHATARTESAGRCMIAIARPSRSAASHGHFVPLVEAAPIPSPHWSEPERTAAIALQTSA
jgi:GT2 family glycosyltransferase/SAM-dependent methyltransferase